MTTSSPFLSALLTNLKRTRWIAVAFVVLAYFVSHGLAHSEEPVRRVPSAAADEAKGAPASSEKLVLAGGCFWGVQGVFQHVKGVTRAVSGYAGGNATTAHYEIVGSGMTGHAESVEITYDPSQVTLGSLLQVFFSVAHDPTEVNRQGPDSGTQYRSAVFPVDATQKALVDKYIAQLDAAHVYARPIATKTDLLKGFYPAERYHQDYLTLNPTQPYIAYNDIPKVESLKRLFPDRYRDAPVLVTVASAAH